MEDCKYRSRLKECSWARSVHIFGLVGFFFFRVQIYTLRYPFVGFCACKHLERIRNEFGRFPKRREKKMKRKRKEKRCLGDEGGTRQDKTVEIQAEEALLDYNCSTVKQKSLQTISIALVVCTGMCRSKACQMDVPYYGKQAYITQKNGLKLFTGLIINQLEFISLDQDPAGFKPDYGTTGSSRFEEEFCKLFSELIQIFLFCFLICNMTFKL